MLYHQKPKPQKKLIKQQQQQQQSALVSTARATNKINKQKKLKINK